MPLRYPPGLPSVALAMFVSWLGSNSAHADTTIHALPTDFSIQATDLAPLSETIPVGTEAPTAPQSHLGQVLPSEPAAPSPGIPPEAVPPAGFLLNPASLNGERIAQVTIYLENPTADDDLNQQLPLWV